MATLPTTNLTLADIGKRLDPDGSHAMVIEKLNETNEVLIDMPWMEGNLPTGHRSTIRSGLPQPTWRKLYGGVQPTKSTTVQVTDNCGMLEDYGEADKAIIDLASNPAMTRLSEDRAHIEGISQEMASSIFYASEKLSPEEITGLAPRYNTGVAADAENAENVLDGGGSGSTNTSVWLVVWGEETVTGIYPKGSKSGGVYHRDLGEVTIENVDGNGGRMQAYRSHYKWDAGLCLKDWRYVVRIANIDVNTLNKDATVGGADLFDLISQAFELPPSLTMGRAAIYCNRKVKSFLRRQQKNAKNVQITMEQAAGKAVMQIDGIPVRRCDALLNTEAPVPFS